MRVLLVEDEARVARFIARGLREQAYAVDLATDGEDALYQAAINSYDAIILDVMIPKKDGFAVCRELRAAGQRVPVLMLTARDAVEDRIKGLDTGADDYLTKPFEFGELLARLRRLIRPALPSLDGAAPLTKRELEILTLLAEGLTQDDIAARLVISSKTVGTHVEHIYRKLRVRSQAQAVAVAFRERIVAAP